MFKQSYGLVLLDELEAKDRDYIRRTLAAGDPIENVRSNNRAANLAGNIFESAAHQDNRAEVRAIVPLSAQYLMKLRADRILMQRGDIAV